MKSGQELSIPVLGVIHPGARAAIKATKKSSDWCDWNDWNSEKCCL